MSDHTALIAEVDEVAADWRRVYGKPNYPENLTLALRLRAALEAVQQTPAVDRGALIELALAVSDDENHAELCHCPLWPQDCSTYGPRRPWSHNGERLIEIALDNLSASGVLLDAAEVEARGLEKAANGEVPCELEKSTRRLIESWLRARAQQVREGKP